MARDELVRVMKAHKITKHVHGEIEVLLEKQTTEKPRVRRLKQTEEAEE